MTNQRTQHDARDIGDDLKIIETTRQAAGAGTWVIGTVAGHKFNALVFPEHAENPDYELFNSRVSKLWIQRLDDETTVVNFDRGWDVLPVNPRANDIMHFLLAGVADSVYA